METLKKVWLFILAAFGLVLGMFFLERNKRQDVEAKLENSEHDKEKAVVAERLASLSREQAAAVAVHEVESRKKLSLEELEEFLRKL